MKPVPLICVILAAGQGTRMKSSLPKVLHPVGNRPMIQHVVKAAESLSPEKIIVVVAPGMPAVEEAVKPHTTVIQNEQLGTGDALKAALPYLKGFRGDVLVAFSDTPLVTPDSLQRLTAARRNPENPAVTVYGMRPENTAQYGRLVLDSQGQLEAIVEYVDATPQQRAIPLCNGGIMALDGAHLPELLERLDNRNAQNQYYLVDMVRHARQAGYACTVVEGPSEDVLGVNSRSELAAVEQVFQDRMRRAAMAAGVTLVDPATVYFSADTVLAPDVRIEPNVFFGPGVTVESGAVIHAFSHIEGARIGPGASAGPFARLRPGTVLQEGAKIGNFVEVKKARIGKKAKVNHLSYVGDATVGENTNIGAGTITCNYDGFDKHESKIGAGVMIGSNTALVAPVTVHDGAYVGAGSVITDDVPANALAVSRPKTMIREGWAAAFRKRKTEGKQA
ncbi:MAG: bifunctional UDP-N-acetylglucosamine diphosphorylase/glucosamine-1-phosphate N-acetyltransferase GlmU [Pseudomonadota bacterium]|nr:bifunctional UDP-N-acetylglucosamine diphosphorylase/glucosamine-1-phosphate N-acetyltransferase GlmU [Pseudomonadota bacterium]